MDMLPPAMDMDILLLATDKDMLLPDLPMVDMLLLSYGYRYASTRTSYGGYASPSYGYRYALVRTFMGDTLHYHRH